MHPVLHSSCLRRRPCFYRCGINVAESYVIIRGIHHARVVHRVRDCTPFLTHFAFARLPLTSKCGGSGRLPGGFSLTRISALPTWVLLLLHLLLLYHLMPRFLRDTFLRGQLMFEAWACWRS